MTHGTGLAEQTSRERTSWDLTAATKQADAWWTVLAVDPLAMRILPILLRWRMVSANLVTACAFLVGIASVTALGYGHFLLGAVLYEARFVLDCLDGKIARVRRTSSRLGATFDRTADALTTPAAYAALGLALAHRGYIVASLALLTALMACLVTVLADLLEMVRLRAEPDRGMWLLGSGGVVAWFRRHRLTLVPSTVEAETLGLFLAPIVLSGVALGRAELVVAGIYGALGLLFLCLIGYTIRGTS